MAKLDVITAKLAALDDHVERVRAHVLASPEALAGDRDAMDLVAFNLMLAVQCCVDIASHVIADAGWRPAPTLSGAFESLRQRGVISAPTAAALGRAVGLRNVVVHGYTGADPSMIHAAATDGTHDLERFASEIAGWAHARSTRD